MCSQILRVEKEPLHIEFVDPVCTESLSLATYLPMWYSQWTRDIKNHNDPTEYKMCSEFYWSVKEVSSINCHGLTTADVGKHDRKMQTHQASDNLQFQLEMQSYVTDRYHDIFHGLTNMMHTFPAWTSLFQSVNQSLMIDPMDAIPLNCVSQNWHGTANNVDHMEYDMCSKCDHFEQHEKSWNIMNEMNDACVWMW